MKKQAAKEGTRKEDLINREETGKAVAEEISNPQDPVDREEIAHKARAINKIVGLEINNKVMEINLNVVDNRLVEINREEETNQTETREIIILTGNRGQIVIVTGQTGEADREDNKGQIKTPIIPEGIKNNEFLKITSGYSPGVFYF